MNEKFTNLDLSKLSPIELPNEIIEVKIRGDFTVDEKTGVKTQHVQFIQIHPLSGAGLIAWSNNPKNSPESVTFEARACLTALIYGADIPEDQAQLLMEYDRESAMAISQAIWVATSNFRKAQKKEAEQAEKTPLRQRRIRATDTPLPENRGPVTSTSSHAERRYLDGSR